MRNLSLILGLLAVTLGVAAQSFSVSPSDRVVFAPGNLQYQASSDSFRFAPEQFSVLGYQNDSIGPDNSLWIDLFGWATSGYDNTAADRLAIHFEPWSWICELGAELDYELNQFGYGPSQNMPDRDFQSTAEAYDWGFYRRIGNDAPRTWRTLSREEWRYLLWSRERADELHKLVSVADVRGLLLVPDGGRLPVADVFSVDEWHVLEAEGCVFLPMAGARYHFRTADVGLMGGYWTSTCHNQASAYFLALYDSYVCLSTELYGRHTGRCVRLARNVK